MRDIIIGTAGHIDHGKPLLIRNTTRPIIMKKIKETEVIRLAILAPMIWLTVNIR